MSFPWMPPIYNVRGRCTQWINGIVTSHDLFCGCNKPFYHLFYVLQKEEQFPFTTKQEDSEIKKCLSTLTDTATVGTNTDEGLGGAPDDVLEFGDLEDLFAENTEETPTTG